MLMVMGTISKMASYVRYTSKCQNQDGLLQLACASQEFSTPTLLQGIDKVIPVDVYVPGCPPDRANRRWRNEITKIS
jgi:NADH-quinone oxidoreductase subunit B